MYKLQWEETRKLALGSLGKPFRGHSIELELEKQAEVMRLKPHCERLFEEFDFYPVSHCCFNFPI